MSRKVAYRNLPQLFLRAREELLRHFRPIINHFGLTEQQWRILRMLGEVGQAEPREICETCHILSPSMAGVLSRMDDMGLVVRMRHPDDQRRVLVRMTPKAEQIVEEMLPLIEEQYHLIEAVYGADLLRQLYDIMDTVLSSDRAPVKAVKLPEHNVVAKAG